MQLHELCKVRNAINEDSGYHNRGYCTAIVKKMNKASVRVALVDSFYKESPQMFLVQLKDVWKLKASRRNVLQRKIARATVTVDKSFVNDFCEAMPFIKLGPILQYVNEQMYGLNVIAKINHKRVEVEERTDQPGPAVGTRPDTQRSADTITKLHTVVNIAYDSVVNFTGDAIVNAANEGCIGGGGIDGYINHCGGEMLRQARKELPLLFEHGIRCCTGNAVTTIAGALPCKFVIHAVGPRFSDQNETHAADLVRLKNAYSNALLRAEEKSLKSIGFCLISAGIYRGNCSLKEVIGVGLDAILSHVETQDKISSLDKIFFCVYTHEELIALNEIVEEKSKAGFFHVVEG